MTTPQIRVQLHQLQSRTRVVTVEGEIDLATVAELDKVLRAAVAMPEGEGGCVTVDLHAVTFMGVCAVTVLSLARELAAADGAELVTVTAEGPSTRVFNRLGWIHDPAARKSESSPNVGGARTISPVDSPAEHGPMTPANLGLSATDDLDLPTDPHEQESPLAPFVAWLATQDINEDTRRRHRESVEAFLDWTRTDNGPARSRRRRYEHHFETSNRDPARLASARAGLDHYAEHQAVVAATLPIDHH